MRAGVWMTSRDGLRIWKILKKIQLSSDHGVEKLKSDHGVVGRHWTMEADS